MGRISAQVVAPSLGMRGRASSRRSSFVSANTSTGYLSDYSGSAGIRAASGGIDVGSSGRIDASDFDGRYDDGRDTPLDPRASRTTSAQRYVGLRDIGAPRLSVGTGKTVRLAHDSFISAATLRS